MRIARLAWSGDDPAAFASQLRAITAPPAELAERVAAIIARVRDEGDAALRALTEELDGLDHLPETLRVLPGELEDAVGAAEPELVYALELAAANIRAVAEAELDRPAVEVSLEQGQTVSVVKRPVGSAGVYAPGGRAAYPSSVLMGAIPARVAGVGRIVLATPPGPSGQLPLAVLAAARIARVDEVHAVGGAQAVAALALGTETIARVDVIAGPGNAWVTEAKRQLYGVVGIDGLAGPSELLVIADGSTDPAGIAFDCLAQAEHGAESPVVVLSPDPAFLDALTDQLGSLAASRPSVANAPFSLVSVAGLTHALALSDAFAPEHLELCFEGCEEAAADRVAGCVFVGAAGATAFGDYAAGSNHVLPTGTAARFGGPLGVGAFMRRTSVVDIPRSAAGRLAGAVDAIAKAEGLPVHGESAQFRSDGEPRICR